jgi:hypothetical protein
MSEEQADHDCTKRKNLKNPSALQPVGDDQIIQTFTCSVCGDKVVERFKLDNREVEENE